MDTFAQRMDAYLDRYCELYRFSGILRVTHRDEILYERCIGMADIEHEIPVTRDSVFTLYSMSKPFCAIGLLRLADLGLIDPMAHPGNYVPEAKNFHPALTLLDLLQHCSGLPDFSQYNAEVRQTFLEEPFDLRKIIALLAEKPANFVPGASTHYANINFALPALLIENVTGRSYADYMREEVFLPLGMKTAVVDRQNLLVPHRVRGYDISGKDFVAAGKDLELMFGAGDILGTVEDIYCLNLAIKHRKLLKSETWEKILTPSPISPFGLGCSVVVRDGRTMIQHNGGHLGFRTLHQQFPAEDLDIILLSNCGFGNSRSTLSDAIQLAFFGKPETKQEEEIVMDAGFIPALADSVPQEDAEEFLPSLPPRASLSLAEEMAYLGEYPGFRLEKAGEDFCLTRKNGQRLILYPTTRKTFANRYIDEEYPAWIDPTGKGCILGQQKKGPAGR